MAYLQHKSGGGKRSAEKYYISCKDPNNWLKEPDALDVNATRAIIKALISDGVARKNPQVVIKIGVSQTIAKEYQIAERLKDIPGFIRFICLMQCHDDIQRYRQPEHVTRAICSQDAKDPMNNVLVMNFLSIGSMRNYPFYLKDVQVFKSCMKQLILSLYFAFNQ